MNFEKKIIYKFGILKNGAEGQFFSPEFATRWSKPSISGDNLIKNGIKTFDDYLNKNPHNYPTTQTVHCYKVDGEQNYIHVAEGNPFDVKVPEATLADSPVNEKLKSQGNSKADNGELVKELKRQIEEWKRIANENQVEINEKLVEIQALNNKILKAESDKIGWEYKKKEYLRIIDELNKKIEAGGSGSGLADRFKTSLADKSGEILNNIVSNPKLADAIINIASKVPYLKDMMSGPPQAPVMADGLNTDGIETRVGEFDENS